MKERKGEKTEIKDRKVRKNRWKKELNKKESERKNMKCLALNKEKSWLQRIVE